MLATSKRLRSSLKPCAFKKLALTAPRIATTTFSCACAKVETAAVGFSFNDIKDLTVTDAKTSATVIKDILSGKENGPRKDIVILNAAAAIIAAGMADDFASAAEIAAASISEGKASASLEKLIEVSNS